MIRVKDSSVSLVALCPQILLALNVADDIFTLRGVDTIVTSANDGRHALTSLHYDGKAVDIRIKHIHNSADKLRIADTLSDALGRDFDVILEGLDEAHEHIHIEWQPRRR